MDIGAGRRAVSRAFLSVTRQRKPLRLMIPNGCRCRARPPRADRPMRTALCGPCVAAVAVGSYLRLRERAGLQHLPHVPAPRLAAGGAADQPALPADEGERRFRAELF